MQKTILVSLCAAALWACGPDATAMVGAEGDDVDGLEVSQGELTSSSRVTTWFPLQEGNSWTFKSTSTSRTVTVTNVGNGMAQLTGLFDQAEWIGTSSASSNSLLKWDGAKWQPFVRFGYAATGWKTGEQVCTSFKAKRVATGASLTTAVGPFADTRTIGFEQVTSPTVFCRAPAFSELTFVPNVGLVAFKTGRNEQFTLASAVIGGKPFTGASAKLTLDAASYVSNPNTIRCITQPCPSNEKTASAKVTFEVRNTTASAVKYQFTSGCQFDVELVSAAGSVVKRLSDDRACTTALTSLTLAPGQTKTFTATIELKNAAGAQLDGEFTARAKLVGSGTPSASAPFAVRVLVP